jgi:hypothetical protein
LSNTSLPHTTQTVTFDGKRNSGLPGASEANQKTYSANATGHYAQGGAAGAHPQTPNMSLANPAAGNADINLYIYVGNNPINAFDPLGLASESGIASTLCKYGQLGENFLSKMETLAEAGWTFKQFDKTEATTPAGDPAGGTINSDQKVIYVLNGSDAKVVDKLYHEVTHTSDRPFTTVGEYIGNEVNAHTKTAEFQRDTGRIGDVRSEVKSTKEVNGKKVKDIDGAKVESYVREKYTPTIKDPNQKPGFWSRLFPRRIPAPDSQRTSLPPPDKQPTDADYQGASAIDVKKIREDFDKKKKKNTP